LEALLYPFFGWESLPKLPIFLIWVENPGAAGWKSLPKRRKTDEKGRESLNRMLQLLNDSPEMVH
jgi:hypothetical protein